MKDQIAHAVGRFVWPPPQVGFGKLVEAMPQAWKEVIFQKSAGRLDEFLVGCFGVARRGFHSISLLVSGLPQPPGIPFSHSRRRCLRPYSAESNRVWFSRRRGRRVR